MILIITEKKSQVEQISDAMGWKKVENGVASGDFNGEKIYMTCARGHILRLKNPDEVLENLQWGEVDRLTPIPETFEKVVSKDPPGSKGMNPKGYFDRIKKYAKDANEIMIAADPDREGDLIGWEIVEKLKFKGKISRLSLGHGMDKKAIKRSFSEIGDADESKKSFRSAEARERGDWAYQIVTRVYTYFGRRGALGKNLCKGKGPSSVASLGRVQTPVLNMINKRCEEIENFVSHEHFTVKADFKVGDYNIEATYKPNVTKEKVESVYDHIYWQPSESQSTDALDKPLFINKSIVENFMSRLKDKKDEATILSFNKRTKEKHPPKPYDLATINSEGSKKLKKTATEIQKAVESLYLKGYTSYPRTDEREIPDTLYADDERNVVFDQLLHLDKFSENVKYIKNLHNGNDNNKEKFKPKCFSSKGMPHYAIIPTSTKADINNLTTIEREVYMMIAERYILNFYPPALVDETTAVFRVPVVDLLDDNESFFNTKSEIVTYAGYMDAFSKSTTPTGGSGLPDMKKGDYSPINNVYNESKNTTPPQYYDDASITKAMLYAGRHVKDPAQRKFLQKTEGIGRPSSRTGIVDKLLSREYILRNKKGQFIVTILGKDILKAVPEWMKSPAMTAVWEGYLETIASASSVEKSEEMRNKFIRKQYDDLSKYLKQVIETNKGNINMEGRENNDGKPSENQLKYAESIARVLNIKIPSECKKSRQACSDFIENNKKESMPTVKMIEFAENIANEKGMEVPQEARENFDACRSFIDENRSESGSSGGGGNAPTPKMVELAERLAKENDKDLSDEAKSDFKKCKEFIDENMKNRKPSEKMVNFARILIEKHNIEAKDGWEKDGVFVKQVLDEYGSKK